MVRSVFQNLRRRLFYRECMYFIHCRFHDVEKVAAEIKNVKSGWTCYGLDYEITVLETLSRENFNFTNIGPRNTECDANFSI